MALEGKRWRPLAAFLRGESGATTVDTVVLAAGVAGIGLAVMTTLADGILDTARGVNDGMIESVEGIERPGAAGDEAGADDEGGAAIVNGDDVGEDAEPAEAEAEAEVDAEAEADAGAGQDPAGQGAPQKQKSFWQRLLAWLSAL